MPTYSDAAAGLTLTHYRQRRRIPSSSAPRTCATSPCGGLGTCPCPARTKTVTNNKKKKRTAIVTCVLNGWGEGGRGGLRCAITPKFDDCYTRGSVTHPWVGKHALDYDNHAKHNTRRRRLGGGQCRGTGTPLQHHLFSISWQIHTDGASENSVWGHENIEKDGPHTAVRLRERQVQSTQPPPPP